MNATNKTIEVAINMLAEHFPNVQVLASRVDTDGRTYRISQGVGDWYARQGLAHEFIQQDIAQEAATQIAEKLKPPEEE